MAIATLAELKSYLNLEDQGAGSEVTANDTLLRAILDGAEAFAEGVMGRHIAPDPPLTAAGADTNAPVAKTFTTGGRRLVSLPRLRAVTSVGLGGTAVAAATAASPGYVFVSGAPYVGIRLIGMPLYFDAYEDLTITGRWGFNPVPADIKDAVLTLAARRYRERDAGYADTVADAEGGSFTYYRQLPPSVKAVFDLHRHVQGMAA